jgi:hypothetical protein
VFSGMLGVTLFGIFLMPVFFYVIRRFSRMTTRGYPQRIFIAGIVGHEMTRRGQKRGADPMARPSPVPVEKAERQLAIAKGQRVTPRFGFLIQM